jgi:hypothetical protein
MWRFYWLPEKISAYKRVISWSLLTAEMFSFRMHFSMKQTYEYYVTVRAVSCSLQRTSLWKWDVSVNTNVMWPYRLYIQVYTDDYYYYYLRVTSEYQQSGTLVSHVRFLFKFNAVIYWSNITCCDIINSYHQCYNKQFLSSLLASSGTLICCINIVIKIMCKI